LANRHKGSDQWLYVISGTGQAVLNGDRIELREGTLVVIQRGDRHEIRNTGSAPLRTLNVYVPPAYTEKGEELPRGGRDEVTGSWRCQTAQDGSIGRGD